MIDKCNTNRRFRNEVANEITARIHRNGARNAKDEEDGF